MSKGIVALIKKIAEEADELGEAPGIGTAPAQPAAQKPSGPPRSKNIAEMQKALQALAKDVVANFNIVQGENKKPTKGNDFVVNKFLAKTDIKGIEYHPKAEGQVPANTSTILQTMNDISNEPPQKFADGRWGPKTNAALRATLAFAKAIFNLSKQFGADKETNNIYTEGNLNNLESSAPKSDKEKSFKQKDEDSVNFTSHVVAIHKMFDFLKKKVINNLQHQSFGVSYKKEKVLSQNDQALKRKLQNAWFRQRHANNAFTISVSQPGGAEGAVLKANLNYSDLISPERFEAWLNGPAGSELTKNHVERDEIIKAIRNVLEQIKSTPATNMGRV